MGSQIWPMLTNIFAIIFHDYLDLFIVNLQPGTYMFSNQKELYLNISIRCLGQFMILKLMVFRLILQPLALHYLLNYVFAEDPRNSFFLSDGEIT